MSTHPLELVVRPADGPADVAPEIRVLNAAPGSEITITIEARDADQYLWRSVSKFRTDAAGEIDVARQEPIAAEYRGADGSGPWWSMQFADHRVTPRTFAAPDDRLVAMVTASGPGGPAVVRVTRQWQHGAKRRAISGPGYSGFEFVPDKPNGAGILVVPGSTGLRTVTPVAALLASHGYRAVAMAYMQEPGLPPALREIPVEVIGAALGELASAGLDPARTGLIAYSVGTQGALSALALGRASAGAAAAIGTSSCVWQALSAGGRPPEASAWSNGGEGLPWLRMHGERLLPEIAFNATAGRLLGARRPRALHLRQAYAPGLDDKDAYERAAIAVERIDCPLLLAGGTDDQMWPAVKMIDRMAARRRRAGKSDSDRYLRYAGAGHFLRPPLTPTTVPWTTDWFAGGNAARTAAASANAWDQLLEFFADHLGVAGSRDHRDPGPGRK